jgi:hypothetical protein
MAPCSFVGVIAPKNKIRILTVLETSVHIWDYELRGMSRKPGKDILKVFVSEA